MLGGGEGQLEGRSVYGHDQDTLYTYMKFSKHKLKEQVRLNTDIYFIIWRMFNIYFSGETKMRCSVITD